jgi:HPt (histidine-containing phosphotransfer) domain-containing protein
MYSHNSVAIAFAMPGGEGSAAPRARPVDLAHLARQTLGDRALEQEVLKLFLHQAITVRDQLADADARERLRLAHNLKGSARGVGAFAIADCVAEIETRPDDKPLLARLSTLIDEVRDFISAINR